MNKKWWFLALVPVVSSVVIISCGMNDADKGDNTPQYPPEFISVAAGTSDMGDSTTPRMVTINEFEISKYEITNKQFAAFLKAYGQTTDKSTGAPLCHGPGSDLWGSDIAGKEEYPAERVTWTGAKEYASYYGYRLPTEAEWEYAARGTDGRKYPWGNTEPDSTYANYSNYVGTTTPVGSYEKGKSWCGAYDMAGNVFEWCEDDAWFFGEMSWTQNNADTLVDPVVHDTTESRKLYRGGCAQSIPAELLCTKTWSAASSFYPMNFLGFRVARSSNRAPYIYSVPDTTTTLSGAYTYDVDAADVEDYEIAYSLVTPQTGMTINDTGLITWTAPSIVGAYDVVVKVTDKAGTSSTQSFSITVSNLETVEFVPVAGGTFEMGDSSVISPLHNVTLSSFQISKHEITNTQFAAFLNDYGQSKVKAGTYAGMVMIYVDSIMGLRRDGPDWVPVSGKENCPVVNVTWYGANEFAQFRGYSLPTEAQWEYAAGGTTRCMYPWGDTLAAGVCPVPNNTTAPVGGCEKNKSWCGAYDMAANVQEWCSDWYDLISSGSVTDPIGPASGIGRVIRGSYFGTTVVPCTYRIYRDPAEHYNIIGLRVVKSN